MGGVKQHPGPHLGLRTDADEIRRRGEWET